MTSQEVKEYLQGAVFVVEATNFEQFCLWEFWAIRSDHVRANKPVDWEDDPRGFLETVGHYGEMPVTVSINKALLNGQKVVFYYSPSIVTHSGMVEKWIEENCKPQGAGYRTEWHCDAQNFHLCAAKIRGESVKSETTAPKEKERE